jgi:flagellar hook assembly protein FlgD
MSAALSLPQAAEVHAVVRDLQGRTVRELSRGTLPAGNHVITWDGLVERGARAHAGVYFVTVSAGAQKLERKFVLLR